MVGVKSFFSLWVLSISILSTAALNAPCETAAEKKSDKSSAAPVSAKIPELCKDAIDPFRAGIERKKFFRDSGTDNKMTEDEFIASLGKKDGYGRIFDRWDAFLSFDKDKDGKINWLEAERCRRELRKVVMAKFDTDRNGRLTGKQRDDANKALLEGKIFAKAKAATKTAPLAEDSDSEDERSSLSDEDMQEIQEKSEQYADQMIEKYDLDGNGELSADERRQMHHADEDKINESVAREMFDLDEDGQTSEQELSQASVLTRRLTTSRELGMRYMMDLNGDGEVTKFEQITGSLQLVMEMKQIQKDIEDAMDTDGDGEVSSQEHEQLSQRFKAKYVGETIELHQQYDYDGDGVLNEQEKLDMQQEMDNIVLDQIQSCDTNGNGYYEIDEKRDFIFQFITQ